MFYFYLYNVLGIWFAISLMAGAYSNLVMTHSIYLISRRTAKDTLLAFVKNSAHDVYISSLKQGVFLNISFAIMTSEPKWVKSLTWLTNNSISLLSLYIIIMTVWAGSMLILHRAFTRI